MLNLQFRKLVMDFIKFAWHGQSKLWVIFWVCGPLLVVLIKFINNITGNELGAVHRISNLLCLFIYFVILWRCALNTKHKILGYIVRVFVAIFIIACACIIYEKEFSVPKKGPVFIDYRQQPATTTYINRQKN